jgi:hypothetical protein
MQGINGGLLGTGFAQWGLLLQHLIDQKIKVKYVAVIFLSDDYRRQVWNFSSKTLGCIKNYHTCNGDENFYGMPAKADQLSFLENLHNYRIKHLERPEQGLKAFLKKIFPASATIYFYVKNGFKFPEPSPAFTVPTSENVIKN